MNKIVCLTIIAVICFLGTPEIYISSNFQDLNLPTIEVLGDSVDNSDILEVFDADTSAMIRESTLFSTDHYATYYFKNLTTNYGKNCVGSCSYVAIGMLLSYYDTYWDDSIIPDSFDQPVDIGNVRNIESISSPGIKNDGELMKDQAELWGVAELSNDQYFTVVQYNYNRYFHLNLINMGLNEYIYKLYELFDRNPYGLGVRGRAALIDYYLYDYMGFDEDDISYEYVTTDIENYIKEKVSQGIPVLVAIGNSSNTGHAFIVYDYDENTGKLYGHLGWGSNETHVDISTIYSSYYFKNALTLNINTPHSCSNNYVDSEGNPYCSCYFSCHPEHVCTYAPCEDDDSKHIYTLQLPIQGRQHLRS